MLKCLRSENEGEYCNNEFDDYYSHHGIRREKIVPRTPQENFIFNPLSCNFISIPLPLCIS